MFYLLIYLYQVNYTIMANIVCPEGCDVALPEQEFDLCAPEVNDSQITEVFYAKGNAAPFTDWKSPVEWATRLDQVAVGDKIRKLVGIGSKPKPTAATKEISKQRKITTNRSHSISFKIDETNQKNHDAMRLHQCGGFYTIWYKSGNTLNGGNEGIVVSVDPGEVLGEGNEDSIILDYLFEWKNKHSPERCLSPI